MSALSATSDRGVPMRARELAARLSALFERDVEIVRRLNDAQRRVREANELLWSGLSPDAFGLIYDGIGPASSSQIAAPIMDNARDAETAVLGALRQIHWSIHRGFCEYQSACEERRGRGRDHRQVHRGSLWRRLQRGRRACGQRARAR